MGILGLKVDWCSYKFIAEDMIKDKSFFMDKIIVSSKVVIVKSSGLVYEVLLIALYSCNKSFLSLNILRNKRSLYFLLPQYLLIELWNWMCFLRVKYIPPDMMQEINILRLYEYIPVLMIILCLWNLTALCVWNKALMFQKKRTEILSKDIGWF